MADIKQALRDFVATSNSGKYSTEDEILSKFPELQGYDKQLLRDFVATSNSGKYANEDEVFAKFPEFNADVKKKDQFRFDLESGSSQTQQSSGYQNAQSSQDEYLRRAREAGWNNTEEYARAGHRYKENVSDEELEYIQPTNKKVIYRGDREGVEQQVAPQVKQNIAKSTASESTAPVTNIKTMPKSVEEGIGQAKISKLIKEDKREEDRAKGLFSLEDINEMDEDPNNFNLRYYNYFKEDADKSGDALKFSNDLRNKYADQFIDSDFKEEFSIANEMDRLREKMASELEKMSANGDPENPEFKKLIDQKRREYQDIFNAKQKQLEAAREKTNQKYKNRIAEIDNLFKTGEAAMREDALIAEKNELQRKISIIELAKDKKGMSSIQEDPEYKTIPGANQQEKLLNLLNSKLTAYKYFSNYDRGAFAGKIDSEKLDDFEKKKSKLESEIKDLMYLTSLKRYANPEDRPNFLEAAGESFSRTFVGGALDFTDSAQQHSENLKKISEQTGIEYGNNDKSYIEYTAAPADPYSAEWWADMTGVSGAIMTEMLLTKSPSTALLTEAFNFSKSIPQVVKIASKGLDRYNKMGSKSRAITNTVFNAVDEGVHMELTNQMLHGGNSDELTFAAGFLGSIASAPINKMFTGLSKLTSKAGGEIVDVGTDAVTAERAAVLEALGANKDEVKNLLNEIVKPGSTENALYMIEGSFGNNAPKAIKLIQQIGSGLIARPTGEVVQEFGEEFASIYRESDTYQKFVNEFKKRFPDADSVTQFVVASYVMGLAFGVSNTVGDVFTTLSKTEFDKLSPEQQEIAKKAMEEATNDVKESESEVISEVDKEEMAREKTPEEKEWQTVSDGLQSTITEKESRSTALNEEKKKIYDTYGITDPKTEDVSNISESDARKLKVINDKIEKTEKERLDAEVELDLHNNKKPQPAETTISSVTPETIFTTKKEEENAVQEPSTEEVLPREQGATTETGGQPQGVGQDVQGQEVTQEGGEKERLKSRIKDIQDAMLSDASDFSEEAIKRDEDHRAELDKLNSQLNEIEKKEVSQEGVELGKESIPVEVNKLNQETFTEDVTPEKKDKVEEQNQKDEDEAINEIYDFNDEIKSIGTKEQFAQFLRSLSPVAAFSRIAWHNTSKPQLEPREGQYYTNTRKNAEDTYKQENTFPAIVFGNAPKKASFDEVQDVDTEAVKGEGADVVVTDDLSPAIGADMNYREFVPTSADQVIPIGTKENIEAFKAFVEKQNTAPEAKVETEEKVQPEISLSGLVDGFTPNTYYAFDPRGRGNAMKFIQDRKSFAEVVDKDGKKYVVVGLALEGNKRAYGAGYGRDRFSFASAEFNESTPDNIVEILTNAARDNFKTLHKDFNYEKEAIKPITEINPELEISKKESKQKDESKAKEAVKEEVKPAEEVKPTEEKEPTEEKVQPEAQEEVQTAPEEVKPTEEKEPTAEEQTKMEEEAAKSEAMTPKNMKDLIGIYRKVFNLPYHKALVSAMISNRLIKQMAKRAGVTPEQMYQKLSFQQITEQQLKGLSKNGKLLKQIVGKDAKAIKGKDFDFDGEYDVVANGSKIGKIHYDRSLKSWMNSEFYRGSERAGTYKWIFGDILGDTKQEAIDELVRRYNEAEQNQSEQKPQETKPSVKKEITQEDVDNILGDIQDSGMTVEKSPIERGVYIINENVRLDLRAFDNMINLSSILSFEKGKGSASSVLREIGRSADKRGLTISLDAKAFSEGGLSTSELLDFYSRFGFEIDPNGIFKDDSIEEIKDYLEMNPNESVGMIRTPSQEILFQNYGEKTRGAVTIAKDGRAIIYALTDANASTPLHELAHVFEHYLTKEEKAKIIKSAKTERWTKETSEYFARGFEKYLATGESSNPIFEKFKQFLLDIYQAIKGSPIDVKLNKQMKAIYAEMLGEDLTENLGETLEQNVENEVVLEEKMAKSAVDELMAAKKKRGSKKIEESKNVKEKYGEMGKKLDYIDRNFDKLIDKLGITKSCWLE